MNSSALYTLALPVMHQYLLSGMRHIIFIVAVNSTTINIQLARLAKNSKYLQRHMHINTVLHVAAPIILRGK